MISFSMFRPLSRTSAQIEHCIRLVQRGGSTEGRRHFIKSASSVLTCSKSLVRPSATTNIKSINTNRLVNRSVSPKFYRFISTMRFVRFEANGRQGLGIETKENGDIVDLSSYDTSIGTSMQSFISGGDESVLNAKKAVESGSNILQRSAIKLLAPISDPGKILCIGMNYRDHCEEQNIPVPQEPVVFSKFNNSIIGPSDNIPYPSETKELDWEVELVIVVGKGGKNIKEEDAMKHVFGYTVAHDVSARDWQLHRNGGQFLLGKSMDGFCPLGPAIVAKEDLKDPHNLKMWTIVNGVNKQDGNTSEMVFKTEQIIAFLSRFFTLTPGDIILTGTPPGVGVFRNPPEYLKKGDTVEVGVEGIGSITNKIE